MKSRHFYFRIIHLIIVSIFIVTSFMWYGSNLLANVSETAGGQTIVSSELFNKYWGAFYGATGIRVGNNFYLYVMGGHVGQLPGDCYDCAGDQIMLFKAPYTLNGMKHPFQFVKRISPCPPVNRKGTSTYNKDKVKYFSTGQVLQLDTGEDYVMFASMARDGGTFFNKIKIGRSQNGKNWTWNSFMTIKTGTTGQHVSRITVDNLRRTTSWVYKDGVPHKIWTLEGFMNIHETNPSWKRYIGKIKIYISDIYADKNGKGDFCIFVKNTQGTWKELDRIEDTDENNDKVYIDNILNFKAKNIWNEVSVGSIVYNDNHWEVWAHKAVPRSDPTHPECAIDAWWCDYTIVFREIDVYAKFLSSEQRIYSKIRYMPATSLRCDPFRVNAFGKKILYSDSNDRNACDPYLEQVNLWYGAYVVYTELNNY